MQRQIGIRKPHEGRGQDWNYAAASQGAQGCSRPSEATREAQQGFCIRFQNESTPQIFWFGTSDSRAARQRISVVLKLSMWWQCVRALGKAFRDLAGQSLLWPVFTSDLPVQACSSTTPTWFCDSVFTPAAPCLGNSYMSFFLVELQFLLEELRSEGKLLEKSLLFSQTEQVAAPSWQTVP